MPKRIRDGEADADIKRVKGHEQSNENPNNHSINHSNNNSVKSEQSDNESEDEQGGIDDSKARHDSLRKMQHQKSDKQRRAKIKEGMDQLKNLVSMHGKLESPDQASIVQASIELVHSLRNEIATLKTQIDAAHQHNSQQRLAIQQFQSRIPPPIYNQSNYPPNHFAEMEQTVIQRSNSLLNNAGGVSNAQFAQLASQIQQIRSAYPTNNHQASPTQPSQSPPSYPPMSSQQMAQLSSILQHSTPGSDLNALLASVTQNQQFMPRGSSQSSPQPPHNANGNGQQHQPQHQSQHQHQQQPSNWD